MKFQNLTVFVPSDLGADAKNVITKTYDEESIHCTPVIYHGQHRLTRFDCDMIPYGQTNFESEFVELGIAYTIHHCDKSDPHHRCKHLRFTPEGETKRSTHTYTSRFVSVEDIEQYLEECKEQPAAMYDTMKSIAKNIRKITDPLPWDNQVEYGQRYRAKRMISNV